MNDINVLSIENNSMGKIEFFNQPDAIYSTLSSIIKDGIISISPEEKD